MQKHSDNALKVAEFLSKHPKVAWVRYAGLKTDKYHALQQKYAPRARARSSLSGSKAASMPA